MELHADVQEVRPQHLVAEDEGGPGGAAGLAEALVGRHQVGIDDAINDVAGPQHAAPGQERVADLEAQVLRRVEAEVETRLANVANLVPAMHAAVRGDGEDAAGYGRRRAAGAEGGGAGDVGDLVVDADADLAEDVDVHPVVFPAQPA